jgi:hypothetical protein
MSLIVNCGLGAFMARHGIDDQGLMRILDWIGVGIVGVWTWYQGHHAKTRVADEADAKAVAAGLSVSNTKEIAVVAQVLADQKVTK